jgi:hypothetical protein
MLYTMMLYTMMLYTMHGLAIDDAAAAMLRRPGHQGSPGITRDRREQIFQFVDKPALAFSG